MSTSHSLPIARYPIPSSRPSLPCCSTSLAEARMPEYLDIQNGSRSPNVWHDLDEAVAERISIDIKAFELEYSFRRCAEGINRSYSALINLPLILTELKIVKK